MYTNSFTKLCLGKTINKFITFFISNYVHIYFKIIQNVYTRIMVKSGFIWVNFSQSELKRVCKNNF